MVVMYCTQMFSCWLNVCISVGGQDGPFNASGKNKNSLRCSWIRLRPETRGFISDLATRGSIITTQSDRLRGRKDSSFSFLHYLPEQPVLSCLSRPSLCNQRQCFSATGCQFDISEQSSEPVLGGGGGLATAKQQGEWSGEKVKGANEYVGSLQVVFSDDKVAFTCLLCCHLT